jgi:hypothetical protein
MKVTIIKKKGKNETITRHPVEDIALFIQKGWRQHTVTELREMYNLILKERQPDGQILTNWAGGIKLERLCFAQEFDKFKGEHRVLGYNGLIVIEVNNLPTYEKAVEVRNQAKMMPETLMCFLGASGKSVKIVCRGELFPNQANEKNLLPQKKADIQQFHQNLYQTARRAYMNQFGFDIEYLEPRLDRTIYVSADPEMGFNPDARPFYADTLKHDVPQPVSISRESDRLMPGRTVKRTYRLEWLFIIDTTLGHYFELPDDDRLETLLMEIATRCLNQGIPLAFAQGMTLEHPALNTDKLLLKKTFEAVYAVTLQEDYMKKHKIKPLQSIPNDTLQMMKTEIFLNENFELRKNLMTGVAEYREKYSDDQTFKPLTEEVRNDMTIEAREQGLKSWDQDVNRFIDSTRIEQYDPVNTWLDSLPAWDGEDRIGELALRVPTEQPHWEKYLRYWLVGMVAQWRESDKQLTGNALTPLLIGRQGCGKTRFCKILLPPELRDYYNDKLNFKNEFDLNIALTSFALINIDEFDKTTNSQQIVLKYLLSSSDVKFRPPYGKTIKQYRRYTSFIGTTNQQQPLVDPTGSRRFVCVGIPAGKNIDFTDNLDHRQLYAQALHLFNKGERFWLEDDEIQTLIEENVPYQRTIDLVEMINETFRKPEDGEGRWWSTSEILATFAGRYAYFDAKRATPAVLGKSMNNYRFNFRHRMVNGCSEYWLCEK